MEKRTVPIVSEHIHTAEVRNESPTKDGVVFETCFCGAVRVVRDGEPEPWQPYPWSAEGGRCGDPTWLTALILLLGLVTLLYAWLR
jgi:hypothetical protein